MGTGQPLAVPRLSLASSTTIDLSLLTFFQSIQTTDVLEWQTAAEEFDEIVSKDAFTMSDEPSGLFSDLG
jgi:hypothetical protein